MGIGYEVLGLAGDQGGSDRTCPALSNDVGCIRAAMRHFCAIALLPPNLKKALSNLKGREIIGDCVSRFLKLV